MFEDTIDLAARCSQEEAFGHVARGFFENHGLWDPSVKSMRKTSAGAIAAGTTGLEGRRFGLWSIRSEFEITAFEPDRRFGFRTTTGPMLEEADWTFEPRDGGSSVHVRLRLTPLSVGLRLMAPLMRPILAANVRSNAKRMQVALDAAGSGPSRQAAGAIS